MADDPNWPRASEWLKRDTADGRGGLAVIGAPVHLGSITPGRCDLAPAAIRAALYRYSTWDFDASIDVRKLRANDLGDLPLANSYCENPTAGVLPVSTGAPRPYDG